MTKDAHILDTEEAWENGELGQSEAHVKVWDADDDAQIDELVGLQPISIRLEKTLIEDFKMIAAIHGLSYQPLMRQALRRFADGEKRRLLQDVACQARAQAAENAAAAAERPARRKRAA